VVKIRIYVEGGGSGKLKIECRQAFANLFERSALKDRRPKFVACGTRNDAFARFCTALLEQQSNTYVILLVDSEGPVNVAPWRHLYDQDGWLTPDGATDEQAHLMVQCMEAWFLADRAALEDFFGQGFVATALPGEQNIERISKQVVLDSLSRATQSTKTKGSYAKARHSFDILKRLDWSKVVAASSHAQKFWDTLLAKS
jgi:hypothetical protein